MALVTKLKDLWEEQFKTEFNFHILYKSGEQLVCKGFHSMLDSARHPWRTWDTAIMPATGYDIQSYCVNSQNSITIGIYTYYWTAGGELLWSHTSGSFGTRGREGFGGREERDCPGRCLLMMVLESMLSHLEVSESEQLCMISGCSFTSLKNW